MPLHDVSPGSLSDIRCKVHNSTAFSLVSDANNHAVTFDTNDFDPRGMHSTVTNTSRITFPIAGRWWLFAHVLSSVVASSSGFLMGFRVNGGATWIGLDSVEESSGGNAPYRSISGIGSFAVNDYVELMFNQNSGNTASLSSVNYNGPEAEVQLISVG